jgi:hypothetical protein
MAGRLGRLANWTLAAALVGGAGFAVARAEPFDSAPQYVKFEPIIVPVFVGERTAGLLAVHVALAAKDSSTRARLDGLRPRLVDAYTHALIAHARLNVDPLAPLDSPALESVLAEATRNVTDGNVRVLLLDTLAQPA